MSSLQTSDRGGSLVDQSFAYGPSGDRFSTTRGGLTKFESWEDALGGPASLLTHGRSAYVYGPGGIPLEFIDHDDSASYLWQDAIGSIIGTTSTSGAVSATFAYDTWGRRTAGFGSQAGVLGFAGQVTEPGLDLQYLRARYYDPKTASFLTRDPQEATTRQPYLYAAGNPTMFAKSQQRVLAERRREFGTQPGSARRAVSRLRRQAAGSPRAAGRLIFGPRRLLCCAARPSLLDRR